MTFVKREDESTENIQVLADIRRLNEYVQRAEKIAISRMNPVKVGSSLGGPVRSFNIQVEGPPKHISYFKQLIDKANLKIG